MELGSPTLADVKRKCINREIAEANNREMEKKKAAQRFEIPSSTVGRGGRAGRGGREECRGEGGGGETGNGAAREHPGWDENLS